MQIRKARAEEEEEDEEEGGGSLDDAKPQTDRQTARELNDIACINAILVTALMHSATSIDTVNLQSKPEEHQCQLVF